MFLHFGDWHGEPPLVSQAYSERVLTSRVPSPPGFPQLKMAITVETDRGRVGRYSRTAAVGTNCHLNLVDAPIRILVGER